MINKFLIRDLLNAEFYQYLLSACQIITKHKADFDRLQPLYAELESLAKLMETAMAAEKMNEKIREKNEMDRLRDRLHSRLFNYLKYILYDERDERYHDAQTVMNILKAVGNPTQLSENRQSALMTTLGNRLEPLSEQLKKIGAVDIVNDMMDANKQFITLEQEARDINAAYKLENAQSAGNVKKQAVAIYNSVVDAINAYAKLPHEKDKYDAISADMNTLVDRYNSMMTARKRKK